jgi:hypothetical protein
MHEWEDETLVAICNCSNNKFEVWELPARQMHMVGGRKPKFRTYEKAEGYIAEQYTSVLFVSADDIREEMSRREAAYERIMSE